LPFNLGSMMERVAPPKELGLDSGGRITLRLEPLLGWSEERCHGAPLPLLFSSDLIDASPTTTLVYACNLPVLRPGSLSAPLDFVGQLPNIIRPEAEGDFLASSFPGGQAAIIGVDGERISVQFRWLCVSAHASIGAVWRCFMRVGARASGSSWRALEHDYLFEAGGGVVLNPPQAVRVQLGLGTALSIKLVHPEGLLTCFPCRSARVKVTRLEADGWAKRRILSLWLQADQSVVALFSDGAQKTIATAAPLFQRGSRAA
jgi:hypothetical protein